MSIATLIAIIVAIVAIAIASWTYIQMRKTRTLRTRFGAEYDHLVEQEHGNARRAEAILDQRQKRINKLHIRSLTREECDRYMAEWRQTQEHFVDDPRSAVADADALVNKALRARGYPMVDFEQRAADISVAHPQVVEHYRAAHDIAERDKRDEASTEELRRAMQHYRDLLEGILDTRLHELQEVHS